MHQISILLTAMTSATLPPDMPAGAIVVTASREPTSEGEVPASISIVEALEIDSFGQPLAADILRLLPGTSVSVSGPSGSQTQIRIRGAEANHTLLFVDGIRFNDPAAGNEARFELLGSDSLAKIELIRGPQSALWGAEAIGGVVAVETADPLGGRAASAIAEYGSLDSCRISGSFGIPMGNFGLAASGGWLRSDGIDSFGADGERDSYWNRAASVKAKWAPASDAELGIVGHLIEGRSEYDGFDPVTFLRADTLDSSRNRLAAVRGWGKASLGSDRAWTISFDGSFLDSSNRNELAGQPLNAAFGTRTTVSGQVTRRFAIGQGEHRLTSAIEHAGEDFRARDRAFGGATDQDRERSSTALVAEWSAHWSSRITTDVAVRHDRFTEFGDATTIRAGVGFDLGRGWAAHAAFGEGIAQPTFYDLFGFFPGSFRGNPELQPERSTGWEAGLAWSDARTRVAITGFDARLRDEIVDTFDPTTFLSSAANAVGKSRRRGIEAEAHRQFGQIAQISVTYTYLDADQKQNLLDVLVREVRRPRHSGSISGIASFGAFDLGAGFAYVGARMDTNFDLFPARTVRLDDYLLVSLRAAWRVTELVEAYARIENGLDADYQDVVGYNTAGRTIYAGLRIRLGS